MKIGVVASQAGDIVAARIPAEHPVDSQDEVAISEFVLADGETLYELDFPDDDVPAEPGPEFLNVLQQFRERGQSSSRG